MLPPSRAAAKASPTYQPFYDTLKPCPHGHFSKRYTISGNCQACMTSRREDEVSEHKQKRAAMKLLDQSTEVK